MAAYQYNVQYIALLKTWKMAVSTVHHYRFCVKRLDILIKTNRSFFSYENKGE